MAVAILILMPGSHSPELVVSQSDGHHLAGLALICQGNAAGYALRYDEKAQTESAFVAALLCDTLRPDAKGQQGTWAGQHRRLQLMDYAKVGKWGMGDEKVAAIREHPTPCAELWKRRGAVKKASDCGQEKGNVR